MNVSGASLGAEYLLFSPSIPLSTVIFTLGPHVFICWPAFFVLDSQFWNPRWRSWYLELTQRRQIKHQINIICFSSILRLFHPSMFVQLLWFFLSRLFLAATLPTSVIFVFLLSGLWSVESPLTFISHQPLCLCMAAAMFGPKQPSQTSLTVSDPHSSDWSCFWHRRAASLYSPMLLREEKLETGF